jgi:hypothetical protein
VRTYLENKLKQKGLWCGSSVKECLLSKERLNSNPVQEKKRKERKEKREEKTREKVNCLFPTLTHQRQSVLPITAYIFHWRHSVYSGKSIMFCSLTQMVKKKKGLVK